MSTQTLRLATRKSPLALTQANQIKSALEARDPEVVIEIVGITSDGDKSLDSALADKGGKGLFVKNLQQALLEKRADFAVHCVKDLSVFPVEGLCLAAITKRIDARDVLVSHEKYTLASLPQGARIGTASPRRTVLIKQKRPDVNVQLLRGNVNTRLQKLEAGQFDATLLAAAGLKRLGLEQVVSEYLPLDSFIPCIGQGALAIETREADAATRTRLSCLNDEASEVCITAERAVNQVLGGDCHCAIGAHAHIENNQLVLNAFVGNIETQEIFLSKKTADINDPHRLGKDVAEALLDQGAGACLTPKNLP